MMKKLTCNEMELLSGGTAIIRLKSSEGIYLLDLCTGQVFNMLGRLVTTYPGEWGYKTEGC